MARMIALTPPPKVVLREGCELIATEAGRYADGLRATIQVWRGTLQGCHQLPLAHPQRWKAVSDAIAGQVGCPPNEVVQALLMLTAAVEGILRQQADGPSGPRMYNRFFAGLGDALAGGGHQGDPDNITDWDLGDRRDW